MTKETGVRQYSEPGVTRIDYRGYLIRDVGHSVLIHKDGKLVNGQGSIEYAKKWIDWEIEEQR